MWCWDRRRSLTRENGLNWIKIASQLHQLPRRPPIDQENFSLSRLTSPEMSHWRLQNSQIATNPVTTIWLRKWIQDGSVLPKSKKWACANLTAAGVTSHAHQLSPVPRGQTICSSKSQSSRAGVNHKSNRLTKFSPISYKRTLLRVSWIHMALTPSSPKHSSKTNTKIQTSSPERKLSLCKSAWNLK